MPIYEYKAYAAGGATKTGVIDADTPREARTKLRRENVLVTDLREIGGKGAEGGKSSGKRAAKAGPGVNGRVAAGAPRAALLDRLSKLRSSSDGATGKRLEVVASITRQMGTMLGAGIPLAEALKAVIDQAESRTVETMFRRVRERITQGTSFGDALAEHPTWFSELYVNMVKAGEATGRVDQVLRRLADFLTAQRALQRKVITALTYPMMMIGLGVLVVSILMTVVVPRITAMLEDIDAKMPLPTRILVAISDNFVKYWWVGCLAIAAVSFVIERVYKTDRGRLRLDRFLLRLPVVGELLRKRAISRFTRTFSTLLSSGVAAVQSLEITRNVVGNRVLADATEHIRKRILEGTDIATPLKDSGVFPPVVGYMVAIGEKSGELEQMLDRVSDAYDEEIEVLTERVTTVLEPIMIVVLAIGVGFIVYSIVLPILQMGSIA
jgi:general secretion pathway protein F